MIMSTWNFKYPLQLQITKTISLHYVIHAVSYSMLHYEPLNCLNNAGCKIYL